MPLTRSRGGLTCSQPCCFLALLACHAAWMLAVMLLTLAHVIPTLSLAHVIPTAPLSLAHVITGEWRSRA